MLSEKFLRYFYFKGIKSWIFQTFETGLLFFYDGTKMLEFSKNFKSLFYWCNNNDVVSLSIQTSAAPMLQKKIQL